MKIVVDLDGVLRDLNTYLYTNYGVPYPINWTWKHEDKDIFEWVKEDDYLALLEAPETPFCAVIRTYIEDLELWTCQPLEWRENTYQWINNHIGRCKIRFLNTYEKQERLDFLIDHLLIEDSPNFTNYSRIILIDQPYNRHLDVPHRIYSPKELKDVFKMQGSEQHKP